MGLWDKLAHVPSALEHTYGQGGQRAGEDVHCEPGEIRETKYTSRQTGEAGRELSSASVHGQRPLSR